MAGGDDTGVYGDRLKDAAAATRPTKRELVLLAARRPRIGKIELRIRRAFIANLGQPLTTPELARRCYHVTKLKRWHRYNVRRAASKFAIRVGYGRGPGPPVMWAPKPK